tara:strand:+ start:70 stop:204 length:135 start_codon:yes stop_codon:yes gene_type:complete
MDSRSVPEFFFNQGLTDFFSLRGAVTAARQNDKFGHVGSFSHKA